MDWNKLFQFVQEKILTDIELYLIDNNDTITIHVHKNILAASSLYFYNCFTFNNFNENKLTIEVDDAKIACDIIMSFYGQSINSTNYPEWKYLLETIKCRNFFCLNNDVSLLYKLKVPSEGFELLLEIMDLFDYTNNPKLMRTIKNNIPSDYDYNNFSEEFANEILQIDKYKIISGGMDGSIKIWDAETFELLNTFEEGPSIINDIAISADNDNIIYCVTFKNYNNHYNDGIIKIWDTKINESREIFEGHSSRVTSVAFSKNELKIISTSFDTTIKIWDVTTGKLLNELKEHTHEVWNADFSPDDLKIISASLDKTIKIWDANSYKLIYTLIGHTDYVWNAIFSSDNLKIVSCSSDKSIKIWDANNYKLLNTLYGHTHYVLSVIFSIDNSKIVSGDFNGSIKIWNAHNCELLNTLEGHTSCVSSLAFHRDNHKIISGCRDKSIKIWDVETGELIKTLDGHTNYVTKVIFSH